MLSHCRSVDSGAVITLAATGSVPQSDLQEMVDRLYEELVPRLQNSGLTHTHTHTHTHKHTHTHAHTHHHPHTHAYTHTNTHTHKQTKIKKPTKKEFPYVTDVIRLVTESPEQH